MVDKLPETRKPRNFLVLKLFNQLRPLQLILSSHLDLLHTVIQSSTYKLNDATTVEADLPSFHNLITIL